MLTLLKTGQNMTTRFCVKEINYSTTRLDIDSLSKAENNIRITGADSSALSDCNTTSDHDYSWRGPYGVLRKAAGSMQRLDCSDYASRRAAMTGRVLQSPL